jgi:hypothetical protein
MIIAHKIMFWLPCVGLMLLRSQRVRKGIKPLHYFFSYNIIIRDRSRRTFVPDGPDPLGLFCTCTLSRTLLGLDTVRPSHGYSIGSGYCLSFTRGYYKI